MSSDIRSVPDSKMLPTLINEQPLSVLGSIRSIPSCTVEARLQSVILTAKLTGFVQSSGQPVVCPTLATPYNFHEILSQYIFALAKKRLMYCSQQSDTVCGAAGIKSEMLSSSFPIY